jgi:UDP-glucose 4-epimerase
MTKKIFITGVAGFVGSHLADHFLQQGHQVTGCDNLLGGYRSNVSDDVEFYDHDLRSLSGLDKLMHDCDIVYHTACTAYEGLSVFSPSLIVENTVQISVNAFTAAIMAGVTRFVHCSSMARYGNFDGQPFQEHMMCRPQDPYGIAKYSSELLLQNLSTIHGLDLVIAVPHNIIGPRQKYDDPFRNVASIMTNLMLQGRQPIIYGDGSQTRCFTDIADAVDCLGRLATDEMSINQTFNIGPDRDPITIMDLATLLAEIIGIDLDPIFVAPRPQEVKHAVCSSDKIRQYFGYKETVPIRNSLIKLVDYIKKKGSKPFVYHLPIEIRSNKTPAAWTQQLF